MAEGRSIVHMDLDTFFVSCERLIDSRLNGKPILIGGNSDRGVVASCSYEARTFGIHSAMPMKMAKVLCPEAIVINGNFEVYSKFSHTVTDIIKEHAPMYEKSSIDEFYLDLTGMDKFFGCAAYATELRRKILQETGLPLSLGLSSNKTVSKVATGEAKPNNQKEVARGWEKCFLAPLSIRKIPMVGEKTYQILRGMGIKRIHTLQEIHPDLMEKVLGKNGVMIWKKAHGIDTAPVIPYNEQKSLSTERTFDKDTIDVIKLKAVLSSMTENLAFQLRENRKLTSCVTVKIRYSDFNTYTRQQKIPYTSADHTLLQTVFNSFEKLFTKRLLIRLIGIRFSHLVNGSHQFRLFEDSTKYIRLYQILDKIRVKYGIRSIHKASSVLQQMNAFKTGQNEGDRSFRDLSGDEYPESRLNSHLTYGALSKDKHNNLREIDPPFYISG